MSTTVKKVDVLCIAADLLGPEEDADNVHPEYERAIAELVMRLVGGDQDDKDSMVRLLRAINE